MFILLSIFFTLRVWNDGLLPCSNICHFKVHVVARLLHTFWMGFCLPPLLQWRKWSRPTHCPPCQVLCTKVKRCALWPLKAFFLRLIRFGVGLKYDHSWLKKYRQNFLVQIHLKFTLFYADLDLTLSPEKWRGQQMLRVFFFYQS